MSVVEITIIIAICLAFCLLLILFYRKRKNTNSGDSGTYAYSGFSGASEKTTRANSILVFGEFLVTDKNNQDITHLFTPRLRQVFLIILNYSLKDGISTPELNRIFWADKEADKVKNIRGVTINNLRKILSEVEGVSLVYDKNVFKLNFTEECYCDCVRLLNIVEKKDLERDIDELADILGRGEFLQSNYIPLFEPFKTYLEQETGSLLILAIGRSFRLKQYERTVILSKSLVGLDPMSEIGLQFLIHSLQNLNREDIAKNEFEGFKENYKVASGRSFTKLYSDI